MKTETLTRVFNYNGAQLTDPDPAMTPAEVQDFYSNVYPEIVSAEIEGPDTKGNTLTFTFRRAVGTKGGGKPRQPVPLVKSFNLERVTAATVRARFENQSKTKRIVIDQSGLHAAAALLTRPIGNGAVILPPSTAIDLVV